MANELILQKKSLQIGGRLFVGQEVDDLITLYGATNAANDASTLRKLNDAAGYQVPIGKKFQMVAFAWMASALAASSTANIFIGYADTDLGLASAGAPVSPIYVGGASSSISQFNGSATIGVFNEFAWSGVGFEVIAQKYPFFEDNSASASMDFYAYGFEVDA